LTRGRDGARQGRVRAVGLGGPEHPVTLAVKGVGA
jgi:hypothetical protein